MSTLRFEILGPLRLWRGDAELDAGPRQQQNLLTVLLAADGQPLSIHELIDLIWEYESPPSAVNIVHKYVSGLRRLLEPGLTARDCGALLLRQAGGYRLATGTAAVDLAAFRRHLADARTGRDTDPARSLDHYIDALRLVRGPAGGGPAGNPRAAAVFAAFDSQFFDTAVAATALAVPLGRAAEVLPALRLAAIMNPLHEPVHAALVTALAAAGRQAEALEAFQAIRSRLADELGIDPGRALLDAHRRVLTRSPSLTSADPPALMTGPPLTAPVPAPAQLPPDLPLFTGRTAELARLADLPSPSVVALHGMGGVGKSTLALRFAHQVADRFPDGRLYLDLHGEQDEPVTAAEALRSLLFGLGVPAAGMPDTADARMGLYRSLTAGKRILVLLDNARDPGQVRPLLPNSSTAGTLVTSRRPMAGLAAFDGARLLHVELPSPADARELLDRRLTGLPNRPSDDAADEMIERCGRLPLALAVLGARLAVRRRLSPDVVAAELRDDLTRLSALTIGAGDHDPRTAFSWSYRQLSFGAARLFRLLSVAPAGGVRVAAGACLAGQDIARTRRELAELVEAALVTEQEDGRFSMHVLVRAYAGELLRMVEPATRRSHLMSVAS